MRGLRPGLLVSLALALSGCADGRFRPEKELTPPDLTPVRLLYVDADGFDTILESLLVNQDPVILIQTKNDKPDWDGRLNAWIAAWNRGGRPADGARVRLQAPYLPAVKVDGDSIREFRLLVESLMDRVEGQARQGTAWWVEERTRNRRVNLLKPYNLRFHVGDDGCIQIMLFNGKYAKYYPVFVKSWAGDDEQTTWSRTLCCSRQAKAQLPATAMSQRKNNERAGIAAEVERVSQSPTTEKLLPTEYSIAKP